MTTGSSISSTITALIAIGFLILALGVGLWAWQLLERLRTDFVVRIVVAGFLILVFAVLASKIFSRVE